MADADARFLRAALTLARRGLGRVWPNPAVGCIITQGSRVVARGWTQPGGRPHAETMALAVAGDGARGATAYITLEPCSHYGHTPPCAEALVTAGIARVVSTIEDPNPRVSGMGFSRLRAAGIEVVTGLMTDEARSLNRGFLTLQGEGRPMVTLKLATSLDGRIATVTGESRWITGEASRRLVHLMRAEHDAILVGAGTVRADDPLLDVRDIGLADASPVRVVADGGLSTPTGSRLVRTAGRIPLWLAHRADAAPARAEALEALGVGLIPCPTEPGGMLDLRGLLGALAARGITRLFCEGGGQMAAALLRLGLVDRLITTTAGKVIGGDGTPCTASLGVMRLADGPEFRLASLRQIGTDTLVEWERP